MHIIGATFIISTRSYNWPPLKNCWILNLSLCLENIYNMRWVNFDNIHACKFDQIATHMATWRRVPRSTICWWRWNFHRKRGQDFCIIFYSNLHISPHSLIWKKKLKHESGFHLGLVSGNSLWHPHSLQWGQE